MLIAVCGGLRGIAFNFLFRFTRVALWYIVLNSEEMLIASLRRSCSRG